MQHAYSITHTQHSHTHNTHAHTHPHTHLLSLSLSLSLSSAHTHTLSLTHRGLVTYRETALLIDEENSPLVCVCVCVCVCMCAYVSSHSLHFSIFSFFFKDTSCQQSANESILIRYAKQWILICNDCISGFEAARGVCCGTRACAPVVWQLGYHDLVD